MLHESPKPEAGLVGALLCLDFSVAPFGRISRLGRLASRISSAVRLGTVSLGSSGPGNEGPGNALDQP